MSKLVSLVLLALVAGCSGKADPTVGGDLYGEGTEATEPAPDGGPGAVGVNGANGANGGAGEQGAPGAPGEKGAPGTNGIDNRLTKTWKCDSTQTLVLHHIDSPQNTIASIPVDLWYYAAETVAGDTFVRVGVDMKGTNNVKEGRSSSSFWMAGTWEATNGAGWVLYDAHPSSEHFGGTGNWEFVLNKTAKTVSVSYKDGDYVGGQRSFTVGCI